MYKHVIFDFDGVLCDNLHLAIHHYEAIRQGHFPQLPTVSTKTEMSFVYQGLLRNCLLRWIDPEQAKLFFDYHSQAMRDSCDQLTLFEGIDYLLENLTHLCSSIVSTAYSDAIIQCLERSTNACGSFYKILGREVEMTKTEKINTILKELNLNSSEVVYVGDLVSDILYCRDVPIDIIAVSYGYQEIEELQRHTPRYLVESPIELTALLKKISLTVK